MIRLVFYVVLFLASSWLFIWASEHEDQAQTTNEHWLVFQGVFFGLIGMIGGFIGAFAAAARAGGARV